ncbi:MAG: thiol-disulfide oxidoreductase DCC family protein [Rhodoluna sp.]
MESKKPLLIFDGDCGFCTSATNFIQKRTYVEIAAIPYQYANLGDLGLTESQAAAKVQFLINGHTYAGHQALAQILMLQKSSALKLLGWFSLLPGVNLLSRAGYFLVAKYRHKLPGGTPACKLPQ